MLEFSLYMYIQFDANNRWNLKLNCNNVQTQDKIVVQPVVPLGVMFSRGYGSALSMISYMIIAQLKTSPFCVPFGGGKFVRKISGAVQSLPLA